MSASLTVYRDASGNSVHRIDADAPGVTALELTVTRDGEGFRDGDQHDGVQVDLTDEESQAAFEAWSQEGDDADAEWAGRSE